MQSSSDREAWEAENKIQYLFDRSDEILRYDQKQQQDILAAKPWEKDPHFFKELKMSALALLKMVIHAKSGGSIEVMGLVLGKVDGNTMIVMDVFALPVEGTETRVNAQAQAYEYMTAYMETGKKAGRLENAIGWYHSHPGYGCWLSGIDVSTQLLNQSYQEPFVALVIDPVRTSAIGKVCIGAFRTYPKGYKPPNDEPSEYQSIPLNKIEDFGVHCKQYYSLDITYFKTSLDSKLLDSIWSKYWVNRMSTTGYVQNASYVNQQILDLAERLDNADSQMSRSTLTNVMSGAHHYKLDNQQSAQEEDKLGKTVRDSNKLVAESLYSLMGHVVKNRLFARPKTTGILIPPLPESFFKCDPGYVSYYDKGDGPSS